MTNFWIDFNITKGIETSLCHSREQRGVGLAGYLLLAFECRGFLTGQENLCGKVPTTGDKRAVVEVGVEVESR